MLSIFIREIKNTKLSLFEDSFIDEGRVCLTAECLWERSSSAWNQIPPILFTTSENGKPTLKYCYGEDCSLIIKECLSRPIALKQLSSDLRLPGQQTEVVVGLVRAGRQVTSLWLEFLSHGSHMVTLHPTAASYHPHPGLVRLPSKPGRLPPRDLTGLQGWGLWEVRGERWERVLTLNY